MLQRFVDAAAVEAEIERVRSLSGAALRRRWQAEFGRPLPRSLTVELLRRMIANRIQEEAFGTLDRATLKLLDGQACRTPPPETCWRSSAATALRSGSWAEGVRTRLASAAAAQRPITTARARSRPRPRRRRRTVAACQAARGSITR